MGTTVSGTNDINSLQSQLDFLPEAILSLDALISALYEKLNMLIVPTDCVDANGTEVPEPIMAPAPLYVKNQVKALRKQNARLESLLGQLAL